jgi:DNA-binding phage protein
MGRNRGIKPNIHATRVFCLRETKFVVLALTASFARIHRALADTNNGNPTLLPLTRSFRETVQARARRDVKFGQALLAEAMQALVDGDPEVGRSALRSCINAAIGFEKLGAALGRSPKSLIRMFGPSGNPTAENLLGVVALLQEDAGVRLRVRAVAG